MGYSPIFAAPGAVTTNLAESASSSFWKLRDALAGDTFQPTGTLRETDASAAPFVPFVIVTKMSRATGLGVSATAPAAAAGTIANSGVTRTEKAGTTFSSMR